MGELDVIVLGGAAVDLVALVEELPQRDSLVLARSFERFPGGSAANVAVGLARLGQRVGFVGKMGDDEHGRLLFAAFEEEGVDTRGVLVEAGRPTATCFIAVDERGERIIVALPGAAVIESVEELDLDYLRGARAVYIGPSYPEVAMTTAAAVREGGGAVFCAPGGVHVLRHSAAKLRRDVGESVEQVSSFLDHANLAVTTTYLRRLEGEEDGGWRKVAALLGT